MVDARSEIDRLRRPGGDLDRDAIRKILPYGDEFLFVHRVSKLTKSEVEAWYDIPRAAPYLKAHFIGLPVMPGTLIGEGLAQAGTLLVRYNLAVPGDNDVVAMQVEKMRFLDPALPGETLRFQVRLRTMNRRAARLEGEARVGERLISIGRIVVGIVERKAFRSRIEAVRGS